MRIIQWSMGVLVGFLALACERNADQVERALEMSGDNREHILAMLSYFRDDSLKQEAVRYLISNMPYNTTAYGDGLDQRLIFYQLYSEYGKNAFPIIDSLRQRTPGEINMGLMRKSDIRQVDSTFLINLVEDVFRLRDSLPWSKAISEDMFIRYVLPYRIDEERLSDWRDTVFRSFKPTIDSLVSAGCDRPLDAAKALIRKWNEREFKWTSRLPEVPAVGVANVFDKAGTCREFAHGVVYLMRAAGIPSGIDMVNVRGENNSNHFWPFIVDETGRTYVASTEDPMWRPAEDFDIQGAKIYRLEFGIDERLRERTSDFEVKQPFFSLPKFTDVTTVYKPNGNFTLAFKVLKKSEAPVYLMLASHNEWIAVDLFTDGKYPVFHNVAGGVVGWLGKEMKGSLRPITPPFEISATTGEIRYILPNGGEAEIAVFSKYPMWNRNGDLVGRVMGGVVEGSNDRNFLACDTIFTITDFPKRRFNFRNLGGSGKAYRYYRYRGADSTHCNIAEVELYRHREDTEALRGRVYGRGTGSDEAHGFGNVFDGDPDTSFDCIEPSGGWAAIDLGHPVLVEKIMYAPRNRDNYVRRGDVYELFYFDRGEWVSTGKVTAGADSVAAVVPTGTLYYLKNHTRGKDERIFEYDFGKREQRFR